MAHYRSKNDALLYAAENRLVQVSGAATASFVYDGDGKRVLAIEGGTTTVFIGNYFEWSGTPASAVRYYYAGTTRLAMRRGSGSVTWLLGDHLGSTSVSYDGTSALHQGYKPWGETRFGEVGTPYQFTGQYRQASLGLDFFNARWYDSALGRFVQADTIVPGAGNSQAWDRYAYVNNNPINLIDPSGHKPCDQDDGNCKEGYGSEFYQWFQEEKDRFYTYREWERKLIALAIYSESSNGTYPLKLLYYIGLAYVNRVEMGLYPSLIGAVIGSNSAIQAGNNSLNKDYPELMNLENMSEADISALMDAIEDYMKNDNWGWEAAKAAADRALATAIDPSGGATNFRAATSEAEWNRTMETAIANSRPQSNWGPYYRYTAFGPNYNSTMGRYFWIIFDNRDYCYSVTGIG
jgi:RHS repeat-associated protein